MNASSYSAGSSVPLSPPITMSSVFQVSDLDAFERIARYEERGYFYARDNHPNGELLEQQLAALHHTGWCLVTSSGMAAISVALLGCLGATRRIVASDQLYGRTNQLLSKHLGKFGITTEYMDITHPAKWEAALKTPVDAVIVETISNPMVRIADIPRLASATHAAGGKLIVDNTFSTPIGYRPTAVGADIVVESLTKLISGHADVTLGAVLADDLNLKTTMAEVRSVWGFAGNPFESWLCTRSLPTLALRYQQSEQNAQQLAEWLQQQPGIAKVHYPGLPTHADYQLCQQTLGGHAGYMLCCELTTGRAGVDHFIRAGNVPFCPSLGDCTTTISYPWATSHRYESAESKHQQGITEGLLRISVGIEPLSHIQDLFSRALSTCSVAKES
ncbi:MAG: PLP-dependent transferase [Zavarzinella sp.]